MSERIGGTMRKPRPCFHRLKTASNDSHRKKICLLCFMSTACLAKINSKALCGETAKRKRATITAFKL